MCTYIFFFTLSNAQSFEFHFAAIVAVTSIVCVVFVIFCCLIYNLKISNSVQFAFDFNFEIVLYWLLRVCCCFAMFIIIDAPFCHKYCLLLQPLMFAIVVMT